MIHIDRHRGLIRHVLIYLIPLTHILFLSIQVGFDMRSSTSAADDNITIADTQALDEMLERSELGSVMGSDTYSMPGSLHIKKELERGVTPGG